LIIFILIYFNIENLKSQIPPPPISSPSQREGEDWREFPLYPPLEKGENPFHILSLRKRRRLPPNPPPPFGRGRIKVGEGLNMV